MSGKRVLVVLFFMLLLSSILPVVSALSQEDVNIALYHSSPKQELCLCEAFNYEFVVYNTGDFNETYSFSVSKYSSNFNISPDVVTLNPKDTAKIGLGARLPCSLTQPNINLIAKTSTTKLKAKTPLQISVNSSCTASDINATGVVRTVPKQARALAALFVVLLVLVIILLLLLMYLKHTKKDYWWTSYFKARPERKIAIVEIITIIIVVILLAVIGFKGFQQIGKNESLITTFIGPKNVTAPIETVEPVTNVTITPAFEKIKGFMAGGVAKGVNVLSRAKQFLWPYKLYILAGLALLVLLIFIIAVLVIIIRRRKARPRKIIKAPRRSIKWRYIIVPLVLLFVLALLAASAFLVYKYGSKLIDLVLKVVTKLKLDKVKDFLWPKLLTVFGFAKNAFEFVRPYLLYVVIGLVLLVIIIVFLRRRENRNARIITVKKETPKKARKKKKTRKKKKKSL